MNEWRENEGEWSDWRVEGVWMERRKVKVGGAWRRNVREVVEGETEVTIREWCGPV